MKTSDLVKNTLEQLAPKNFPENTKNDYSEIELTPEETEEALRQGREDKHYRLLREAYSAKINSDKVWHKPSARELYEGLKLTVSKTGKPYRITEDNKSVIHALCLYFSGDDRLEKQTGFVHNKGICLTGIQGVGKTHLMNFFARNPKASYKIPTCKDVAEKYKNEWEYEGQNTIDYYSSQPKASQPAIYGHEVLGFCFGDLGTEEEKNLYGNKMNVIEEIFFKRYESNVPFHMTHFTTNLTGEEIKAKYGIRFYDRLKESCNWIVLKGESFR